MFYVIKQTIKFGIIGVAAGVFIMAGFYAMSYVFSRSMKTDSDWHVLGLPVLGNVWRKVPDEKGWFYEPWIYNLVMKKWGLERLIVEGIGCRNWKNSEETQDRLIVNNLGGVLKEKNLSKAVVVTAMANEGALELIKAMDKIDPKTPYILAGNVLEDPETVKNIGDIDEVFILGKRYITKIDDIQKIKTLLAAIGKKAIGAVVQEDII